MKKILLVGPFRTPDNPVGGVSTFLENLQKSPIGQRYKLVPFTTLRPDNKVPRLTGYDSILRAGPLSAIKSALVTIYHLLKFPFSVLRERPGIVQIHTSSYWTFWENGCYVLMAKLLGKKVILRYGGAAPDFFLDASRFQKTLMRFVLQSCNFMIVQGESWKDFFLSGWVSQGYLSCPILWISIDFRITRECL